MSRIHRLKKSKIEEFFWIMASKWQAAAAAVAPSMNAVAVFARLRPENSGEEKGEILIRQVDKKPKTMQAAPA